MKSFRETGKKWLSIVLTVLLVVGNGAFASTVTAETSELNPGEVRVDKHRSIYELSPGESTDITLSVETEGLETVNTVDVVLAIDISNSMVNHSDGSSTVMELTQVAAKSLASQLLAPNNGSRIALVRYGDFASVYDFENETWIRLNDSTSSATLTGDHLYTSDLTLFNSRVDAIRSNLDSGWVWDDLDPNDWNWQTDRGGTTTEAGLIMTELVAQEATQDSYAVFMSDGVPTSRMITASRQPDGLYGVTRDDSGTATSTAEKAEALAAASSLSSLTDTGVFSIAITLGLSGVDLANSAEINGRSSK